VRRPGGIVVPVLAVVTALGIAVAGAILTTDPASGPNGAVESLSSGSSGAVGEIGRLLPLGFAFAAGMVAAVNPCGFVLLPTYLGVFLGEADGEGAVDTTGRVRRGLVVGGTLAVGFVVLFVMIGLLVGFVVRSLIAVLPLLGLAVGVGLVVAGGYRLAGGTLSASFPERISGRLSGAAAPRLRGYFLFGLAYGTASLSCTLPIFLAVLGGSLATPDIPRTLGRVGLYGLGMGSVVLALTLAAALFKATAVRRLRGAMRVVEPVGTVFLFLAGSYVVYYWLTVGGLLPRASTPG
jgi:cytochrome c-type biogenesis protein